jgi:5-methyltetrahydropteroyltriglutamate--homocysteine methyltransferase
LLEARERLLGPVSPDANLAPHAVPELKQVEDECISEIVRRQEEIGLQGITDGEFRRRSWNLELFLSFTGIEADRTGTTEITWRAPDGTERPASRLTITGPIERHLNATVRAFEFLDGVTTRTAKVTLPAPSVLHFNAGGDHGVLTGWYEDVHQFWDDVVAAYRAEIAALVEAGAQYIQLDDVALAILCDPRYRETAKVWGHDADALASTYAERLNEVTSGVPDGVRLTLHECRGNRQGSFVGAGGYDPVAEILFNEVRVDGFFLEYDTERAGTFEPLRFLPKGKTAVLGLISSKSPELERADELRRRLEDAARFAPLEQLALSPQCGFASSLEGSPVDEDLQWRKLALAVEVARSVWDDAP